MNSISFGVASLLATTLHDIFDNDTIVDNHIDDIFKVGEKHDVPRGPMVKRSFVICS